MIPYGRQDVTDADVAAVIAALKSDLITQGPAVPQFEACIASYCGVSEGIAVNSATSALHIACLALDLGPGDLMWTSPVTFVASANAALYCGADVDFVDVDARTYNLCADRLEQKLIEAEAAGRLPKIVMPVHLCGQSCDMRRIAALAGKYGFKVIEDASHAIGGRYDGAPVGDCRYSDICVFSFHPVKIITTAEGGLATTNDPDLAQKMRLFRSHCVTREEELMQGPSDGPWYYQQIGLGFNYRMTELHAALGLSQMGRLDAYIDARHVCARRYDEALADLPLTRPYQAPYQRSALHLYPIVLDGDAPKGRRETFEELRAAGIGVNVHYIPVYRQPHHAAPDRSPEMFPNAEAYYQGAISLPMFPTLTEADQQTTIDTVARILS